MPPDHTKLSGLRPVDVKRVVAHQEGASEDIWVWKRHIFAAATLALLPFAYVFMRSIPLTVAQRKAARPDYPYPSISDLRITFYALLFFIPTRIYLTEKLFKSLGERILPYKEKWTPAIRADRVDRFAAVCYKLIYFIFATALGFFVLYPTNFLPTSLLGQAGSDPMNMWEDFPYSPVIPYLKEYYLIELGYHTQSMLFHLFTNRSDYLEMMLHHTTAIFLVLFSYFSNFTRVGALVLLVHDIADVNGYLIKAVVDTNYTKVILGVYTSLLGLWAYTRLYVFPFDIIGSIWRGMDIVSSRNPNEYVPYHWGLHVGMLYVLLGLHIYWYAMFLIMGYTYLKTGVTQDIQQDTMKDPSELASSHNDEARYRGSSKRRHNRG